MQQISNKYLPDFFLLSKMPTLVVYFYLSSIVYGNFVVLIHLPEVTVQHHLDILLDSFKKAPVFNIITRTWLLW